MTERLYIIEAPGKVKHLSKLLYQLHNERCEIIATCGHICSNPSSLNADWIDDGLNEIDYSIKPDRSEVVARIHTAALIADQIYLATDDDDEGDVIARDVYHHCLFDSDKPVYRLPLRALTFNELKECSTTAYPAENAANKGDARRIFDRLVGSLSDERGAVGRVQSSLLIALADYSPVVGISHYQIADAYGGRPWTATLPVYADDLESEISFKLDGVALTSGRSSIETGCSSFRDFSELLLRCSIDTGRSASEVARAMQKLYERGDLTYPRSSTHAVTTDSLERLSAISRLHNISFNPGRVAAVRGPGSVGHEAPVPIKLDFALNKPLEALDCESAVLAVITRAQLETGLQYRVETPSVASLSRLPSEVQGLNWSRVNPLKPLAWLKDTEPGFKQWTAEQSLVHFMSVHQLGRPSTIISHLSKFEERMLIDESFAFTEKGEAWAFNAAVKFSGVNISELTEKYLFDNDKDPREMVQDLIKLCRLGEHIKNSNQLSAGSSDLEQDLFDDYESASGI